MRQLWVSILVMAAVTYALRAVPLLVFSRQIENRFVRSFLHYVPYAVLTAMTIPAIVFATSSPASGFAGLAVAVGLAWLGRSLLTVALGAAGSVWLVELLLV